tara:strand:- start:1326 stop:1655 length:330 start_codon:yes stop_codon:yes gene_type:complete
MQDRAPSDIHDAFRRYTEALERLEKAAHIFDREVHGRKPTETELKDFKHRNEARDGAFHKICAWPCADFTVLKAKAKLLIRAMQNGQTLSDRNVNAVLHSITEMKNIAD